MKLLFLDELFTYITIKLLNDLTENPIHYSSKKKKIFLSCFVGYITN